MTQQYVIWIKSVIIVYWDMKLRLIVGSENTIWTDTILKTNAKIIWIEKTGNYLLYLQKYLQCPLKVS